MSLFEKLMDKAHNESPEGKPRMMDDKKKKALMMKIMAMAKKKGKK